MSEKGNNNKCMTPRLRNRLTSYKIKLINLSIKLAKVNSMNKLINEIQSYIGWQFKLKTFINNNGLSDIASSIFLSDLIIKDQSINGGCGLYFGDKRSLFVLNNLQKQVENTILRLDYITTLLDMKKKEQVKIKPAKINIKDTLGYLILREEEILVGDCESSKFKLIQALCNQVNRQQTIDYIFDLTKPNKDKNKTYDLCNNPLSDRREKLSLMRGQIKEVNRAISKYCKNKKLHNFKFRLSLKTDTSKRVVWMEEVVVRRGS